jgi:NSS family neurotransmitter:Na+ symporter
LLAVILQAVVFGWSYGVEKLIPVLNEYSRVKVGKGWVFIIKYILPIFLSLLWIIGMFDLLSNQNIIEIIIQLLIAFIIVIIPLILTKLPSK